MWKIVIGAVSLVGCVGSVPLTPVEISAVAVTTPDDRHTFCVGGTGPQLTVTATVGGGEQMRTSEPSRGGSPSTQGELEHSEFQWMSSGGRVDRYGRFIATQDPLTTIGKPVLVRVAVPDRQDVAAVIQLVPRYDCGTAIDLSGTSGSSGSNGSDGSSGSDGRWGNPAGDGSDASDGRNGDSGEAGPVVDVALGLISSPIGPLAIARVTPLLGTPRYALMAIDHGWLSIIARGGAGGHGGRGGRGGDGGRYWQPHHPGLLAPVRSDGRDGGSGRDGRDAAGGPGGTVTVHYDAAHPELLQLVEADTHGGSGSPDGPDGPPMRMAPEAAGLLFAKELARGLPIVTSESLGPSPGAR